MKAKRSIVVLLVLALASLLVGAVSAQGSGLQAPPAVKSAGRAC